MLAELRTKSQITIPKEIVTTLGLSEGDKFDIYEKDGTICLVPIVVYPKKVIDELRNEISNVKSQLKKNAQPIFDNVDDLFANLEGK